MSALATQEQLDHYDATVEKHVRGEATLEEVWAADPYDGALREMARRYFARQGDGVREERRMGFFRKVDAFVRGNAWVAVVLAAALAAVITSALGHFRPPA